MLTLIVGAFVIIPRLLGKLGFSEARRDRLCFCLTADDMRPYVTLRQTTRRRKIALTRKRSKTSLKPPVKQKMRKKMSSPSPQKPLLDIYRDFLHMQRQKGQNVKLALMCWLKGTKRASKFKSKRKVTTSSILSQECWTVGDSSCLLVSPYRSPFSC